MKAVKVAKRVLKSACSHIDVNICKLEAKVVIKGVIKKTTQSYWNKESKDIFLKNKHLIKSAVCIGDNNNLLIC